ncbi:MAG: transporter substrate-binding domain-containing protein, partial [Spirochaetales bacterium]|nr:transporter substrate-binding domain-containing protein [Spirochaetales bacterium]
MKRLLYLTTAVLLLTGMSLFAQSPDFSFEEKLWIESHRVIRVQNEAEWAPFNFNDRGAPMGYSVEYIEILAEMAGLEVEFISGYSWNEYLNMIRGGELDVMINIVRTPEREEFLSFTEPFIQYSPSIFIREDMEEIRSLEDLYGKRFALQEGYFYKDQISLHPEIEILPVKSTTEAVLAVSRGQADVMIDLMPIVNYLTETLLITNLKPGGAIELENSGITLARIGVRKDWKDLAAILNKCISLVPEETLEALRAKWLGSGSADSSDRVKLIDEEIGFLREHPLIRVYSPVNRPPFSFGEQPRGLAVDYMDTLARTLKIEIEYIRGPAAEGQKALKEGRADILLLSSGGALPNQAGPYFIDPQVIISRNDKAYQTLESLKGKTVALSPDFPYREVLEREFPEIRIADKADLHESLKAVVFGEADAASGGYAGALYTIRNSFLSDLSLTGELNPGEDSDKELFFGVSGDLPLLASALQKAWDSLSGQERNRIGSQWTGTMTPLNPFEGTRETEENDFPLGRIIIITLLMIAAAVVLQQLIWNRRRINTVLDMKKIRLFSLLFLSISILLILLTASVGLIYVRSSMKEDAERNLQAVAITTNEGLSIWIGHKLDALKSEAARPELVGLSRRLMRLPGSRMILAESPLQEETEVFLEGRSSLHEAEGYYLIKSDGTTLASENPEERGLRNRIYDYRPVLMERAFQGETLFIPPIPGRERESMFFVTPVFDASGRVLAVLAVEEDPAKEFTRYCRLGQLGKSGETFAFDDMGVLLSRSRFEEELVRTGLLEPGRSSALNIQLREPQVGGEGPFTLMAASALSGLSGSSTSGYRDYRGKRVYGAWIWNEDLNFAIATEMDEDEAMSSYTRMKNLIYTVLGIILVTATGATLFSITVGERANRSLAAANNSLEERVQKRTKEVREANRNLSNTIEALTHPFYVVDADNYKIVLANSAAKSLSTDGSVTTCHHLTHRNSQPCSCEEHPCPIPLIKEKGEPVVLEHLHFDEKGEPVYVEVYGYPIFDDRGRVVQVIEYSIDITARKNAERDLETARDAAEAATRAKSDFLANMSHEIRTPMNAIIGLSHLIQRTEMTPKQQDYIQKIGGSAQNLLGIINDILDFSKIEAGKLTMESISFDLHEVFENLGSMISPRAQEKNLELVFHVAQDVPGRLKGDPLRLGQILLNLANNAVKFTEAGEIAVSCELIEKTEDHARLKFSVRDTGIGLTEEQQGSLFQAFTQADNSTTRKYGGTGLGLSISKRLSELMGGEIGVESVRGEGSTFFFT